MVSGVDDILEELWPLAAVLREQLPATRREPSSGCPLLDMVGFEPTAVDRLTQATGLPVAEVTARLTRLELDGLVCRCPGGYIRR
jgi:DNA processing protein